MKGSDFDYKVVLLFPVSFFFLKEMEKEKDVEGLLKDLANCKVQLEAKESAYLQLLHQVEYYQKKAEELSYLLKDCESERDVYIEECREARLRIDELESKVKEMADQLTETGKIREQLSLVLSELKATQGELLIMETQLAAAIEAKFKALRQAELMEASVDMEKHRAEDLLKHIAELNEAILMSNLDAIEAEKEKCLVFAEKDVQLEFATETAAQAQKQVEDMRKQLEMQELENQLLSKSVLVDSQQMELDRANELLSSSNKSVSDAVNDLNQLEADLKGKEGENSDQAFYVKALETETNQLKLELKNANDEVSRLNCDVEMLMDELQKVKAEMEEIKDRENEAQVEIALLKSELHKGRSELAAAKAAEARAGSVKSGLYLAVQRLAVEAEEAKKETQRLKQEADKLADESDDFGIVENEREKSYQAAEVSEAVEVSQASELKAEAEERRDGNGGQMTIALEEYKSLIRKAEKDDQSPTAKGSNQLASSENEYELGILKKELEAATAKIGEFRARAEQAVMRAEAAEKAKITLEDQLKRWRERKQRQKAAFAALREESSSREFGTPTYENNIPIKYEPLGKILNMNQPLGKVLNIEF